MSSADTTQNISYRFLVSLHAILPALCLLVAIDFFFFDSSLRTALPSMPEGLLLFSLLFPFPHIVASFFGFADYEYLKYYKHRLLLGIPILLAFTIFLMTEHQSLGMFFVASYTMLHVAFQQTGLALMMLEGRHKLYFTWKWLIGIGSILIYLTLYPSPWRDQALAIAPYVLGAIIILTLTISPSVASVGKSKIGKQFFWATTAIIPLCTFFLFSGYPLFAILAPRLIHDITAFVFYTTHDVNRNRTLVHNFIYRIFIAPSYVWVLYFVIPIFGIIVAYQIAGNRTFMIDALIVVSVIHYFIESFMWKKGSPHRAHIAFAK